MIMDPREKAEYLARQRKRSIAIGLALCALALLFYGITISRMSS